MIFYHILYLIISRRDITQSFKYQNRVLVSLACLYQACILHRSFVSIGLICRMYPDVCTDTYLNKFFYKIVDKNLFKLQQPFTQTEILKAIVNYFNINGSASKVLSIICDHISEILPNFKAEHVIGIGIIHTISEISIFDICMFLGIKVKTLKLKYSIYKKHV